MTVTSWTDNEGNTYSSTTIPEKIVGLSGIDPIFIPNGWSAPSSDDTSTGGGTQDHEKLQGLFGGGAGEGDHYHIDHYQHYIFNAIFDKVFPRDGDNIPEDISVAIETAAKALRGE